ncbi:MAG: Gfo/Idh/MocA family oxidoreductase [Solobacterium sp.]|nr:Gfo/Idh/MocA family oxidoreductase [Solobacterium sp.]
MIQIAVAGPGRISRRFLEGMKDVPNGRVCAFATRNPDRVREYAEAYQIHQIDSFDALCKDPSIRGFYVSTPNHVHYDMIRQALLSGKHVICEKPVTVTADQLKELFELARSNNLVLMEAHKTLYTPTFQSIKEVLKNQELGTILEASAGFCRKEPHDAEEWRLNTPGKGALYDVGCYGLAGLFGLFGTKMTVVSTDQCSVSGTDTGGVFHMDCDGIPMTMRYSFEEDGDCDLRIRGSKGTLTCTSFWKSDRYWIQSDDGEKEYQFPFRSEFTFEAQRFIDRIENGIISDPETESISLRIIELLETFSAK